MQVRVGDLEAGDDEAGARHIKGRLLREADRARHLHQVRGYVGRGVGPRLVGGARDDEDVPRRRRFDRCEGDAQVVCPHEASGPDARDDVVEDSAHATIVTYLRPFRTVIASGGARGRELPWWGVLLRDPSLSEERTDERKSAECPGPALHR